MSASSNPLRKTYALIAMPCGIPDLKGWELDNALRKTAPNYLVTHLEREVFEWINGHIDTNGGRAFLASFSFPLDMDAANPCPKLSCAVNRRATTKIKELKISITRGWLVCMRMRNDNYTRVNLAVKY